MIDFIDAYDVRARIAPALVAAAPGAIALGILASAEPLGGAQWGAGICAVGLALLAAVVVRDRGKALEPELYAQWGGKPTSVILRSSDRTIDPLLKTRYRLNLEKIVPGFKAPSPQEELNDANTTDRRYDMAARFLIERTTERTRFPKVFAHNCGYGFRRNLLGLRFYGLASSVLAVGIGLWLIKSSVVAVSSVLALAAGIAGVVVFSLVVTQSFVRRSAFEYAIHLISASDSMI
jgi:hypothetical protein